MLLFVYVSPIIFRSGRKTLAARLPLNLVQAHPNPLLNLQSYSRRVFKLLRDIDRKNDLLLPSPRYVMNNEDVRTNCSIRDVPKSETGLSAEPSTGLHLTRSTDTGMSRLRALTSSFGVSKRS